MVVTSGDSGRLRHTCLDQIKKILLFGGTIVFWTLTAVKDLWSHTSGDMVAKRFESRGKLPKLGSV